MFWSANLLHETGHQCRATLVHLSVSCYDPSMWSLSVSSDTSASPREQIKPGVFCSAVCWNPAFEEDDLFWSDSSFAPRFSLWHPFLSSLRFYWSTQKSQWKQQMETRRLLPRSHQSAAWHYPTLSSSYFFFSSRPAPPWSLPQLLSQQMWRIQLGDEETPLLPCVVFIGWLHVLCVTFLSTHSLLPLHRDSIPALTDVTMKKCFWRFIQGDWILFFIVDEGGILCFSVATELSITHFCADSICFFHHCHLFLI